MPASFTSPYTALLEAPHGIADAVSATRTLSPATANGRAGREVPSAVCVAGPSKIGVLLPRKRGEWRQVIVSATCHLHFLGLFVFYLFNIGTFQGEKE